MSSPQPSPDENDRIRKRAAGYSRSKAKRLLAHVKECKGKVTHLDPDDVRRKLKPRKKDPKP